MVKKIILAVFFSIFICVFIGFNYLLIQKENTDIGTRELEQEMTAKSATIATQVDRIGDLERRTSDLIEQIATLREQGDAKDESLISLDKAVVDRDELLGRREDLINKLKQGLDVGLVGEQASEWITFINNGDYEKSYARFNRGIDNVYTSMVLSEFRAYYEKQVGMIEVKSLDVMTRGIPESIDSDLVIAVVVDLITPRSMELFSESLDKRRVVAEALAEAEARAEAARIEAEAANELLEQMKAAAENAGEGDGTDGEDADGDNPDRGDLDGDNPEGADIDGVDRDGSDRNGADRNGADPDRDSIDNGDPDRGDPGAREQGAGESGVAGIPNGVDAEGADDLDGAGSVDGSEGSEEADGPDDPEGSEGGADEGLDGDEDSEGDEDGEGDDGDSEDDEDEAADPFDVNSYLTAGAVLEAMAEYEYIYTDDLDESIFNTGENQLFFLMNYKKEANDWEIIRIVQKL
ncbi:MAG: hypothetical protein FWH01_14265 [Oscillospiraceae bacterium]|nr:hypothetical protein [Oscillospiraceae bacterium]